jgi:hypothetical protein
MANAKTVFMWQFKVIQHVATPTSQSPLHGAMYRVWWKSPVPHRVRRRKTMHLQTAKCFSAILVAAAKPPHPHKERKRRNTGV